MRSGVAWLRTTDFRKREVYFVPTNECVCDASLATRFLRHAEIVDSALVNCCFWCKLQFLKSGVRVSSNIRTVCFCAQIFVIPRIPEACQFCVMWLSIKQSRSSWNGSFPKRRIVSVGTSNLIKLPFLLQRYQRYFQKYCSGRLLCGLITPVVCCLPVIRSATGRKNSRKNRNF